MARLTITNATKSFGDFDAVKDVSLDVEDGEFLAVLGPSGCGKTTLLRLIAGFEPLSAGEIAIGGKPVSGPQGTVPPERRQVGIVFQNYALWPHMTVAGNVGYPLKVAGVDKAEAARRIAEALALVNLQGLGDRRPASLSGGQRQRVALARCLVAAPSLVLFDEPLANLDVHLRASMEDEFAAFHERTGTTIVYITHDQAEAMSLADRIAVMDKGRLIQLATPQTLYREPASAMVAGFIAQGNVVPAIVNSSEAGGTVQAVILGQETSLRCVPGEQRRDGAQACIRDADIGEAGEDEPGIDGIIRRAVYKGGSSRIEFVPSAAPQTVLHFDRDGDNPPDAGRPYRLRIRSGWLIPEHASP